MYEREEIRAPNTSTAIGNLRLFDRNTTVGELTFISSREEMMIEELFVKPSLRGRGFGTRLLRLAEQFAAKHGLRQIRLKPSPIDTMKLTSLTEWYRRRGYTPYGPRLMGKSIRALGDPLGR